LLGTDILVKSVSMSFLGTCLREITNPIVPINITAGELLRYKVPETTCYIPEDGKNSQLNLKLLTTNRRELSPDAWLQFDAKNQEFVGIPLEEEFGQEEYQLVCSYANGSSTIDGIEVNVLNRTFNERFVVEFSLQFAPNDYNGVTGVDGVMASFSQPILRHNEKVSIVEKLAKYFGDSDTTNIILKTFDADNGKVVWHNKSLSSQPCDFNWVKNQLINSKGKVVQAMIRQFQPYLKLVDVNAVGRGSDDCADVRGPDDSDPFPYYLLIFIISAVIITILVIFLACMLHKKCKAGKLNLFQSEVLPLQIPVVPQDELFDEHKLGGHGGGNKQPILLREDLNGGSDSLLRENDSLLTPAKSEAHS